jgi:serine/threonine protein kinase
MPLREIIGLTSRSSKLKLTMRQATSRSGVSVVLKTIVDSNERQLLEYLSGIKVPSNHTIQLLDAIDLSIGKTIIVLPWKSPLDEVLRFDRHPDDVVSLCLQFIEGVDFLHRYKVAHCDLKPGNVVVDTRSESARSPRLFIIDFDLAQSVESEETMTEGWCGTPPWIAPELGFRDGPTQRYNPILADRWVCGRMINYFATYFPACTEGAQKRMLLAFAKQLLHVDPRHRPELKHLLDIHGPIKRKSAGNQGEPVPKRHAVCLLLKFVFNHRA